MVDVCIFPTSLKLAVTPASKNRPKNSKKNYRHVSILQKLTKFVYLNQYQNNLKISLQNLNVVLGKVSVHIIV